MAAPVLQPARRQEEKTWQDNVYSSRPVEAAAISEKIKARYLNPPARPLFPLQMMFRLVGDVRGKRVLCCGCGDENSTVLLALRGAEVWAFDISPEAIRIQRALADANGVAARVRLFVSGIEDMALPSGYFDIVFGAAILHHVPDMLPNVAEEVRRVLKGDGFALFNEPFANSAWLQRLRRIVPVPLNTSPRERQLTSKDMEVFARHFVIEQFPFYLFSRLWRLLEKGPLETSGRLRRASIYGLFALDAVLLRVASLQRLAGIFVLKLKPKTSA